MEPILNVNFRVEDLRFEGFESIYACYLISDYLCFDSDSKASGIYHSDLWSLTQVAAVAAVAVAVAGFIWFRRTSFRK